MDYLQAIHGSVASNVSLAPRCSFCIDCAFNNKQPTGIIYRNSPPNTVGKLTVLRMQSDQYSSPLLLLIA